MKLATQKDGTRDGRLVVVSHDAQRCVAVPDIASNLLAALDRWVEVEPSLRQRAADLSAGRISGELLDVATLAAPLPRTWEWVDGSAYLNHVRLVRKARNAEPPATLETDPLVYQGGSSHFLAPHDAIEEVNPTWGLDFEAELGVVLRDTPIGTSAAAAGKHILLLALINDVTLRNLIPDELAKGFGFFTSKPATALAPFLVTPDELGAAWDAGRLHARMKVWLNGALVGDCDTGPEMHFSFPELIAHISKTRAFNAGTLLGSGTISNVDPARGITCLAERRTREVLEQGKASTPFLKVGDEVRIEVHDARGRNVFGTIEQRVCAHRSEP